MGYVGAIRDGAIKRAGVVSCMLPRNRHSEVVEALEGGDDRRQMLQDGSFAKDDLGRWKR